VQECSALEQPPGPLCVSARGENRHKKSLRPFTPLLPKNCETIRRRKENPFLSSTGPLQTSDETRSSQERKTDGRAEVARGTQNKTKERKKERKEERKKERKKERREKRARGEGSNLGIAASLRGDRLAIALQSINGIAGEMGES
jgi:hypothetical protein